MSGRAVMADDGAVGEVNIIADAHKGGIGDVGGGRMLQFSPIE